MDDKRIKLTLVGESKTGKTSLKKRYVHDNYSDNEMETVGANFNNYLFDPLGKRININVWDTPGKEPYRGLVKIFYKDSDIVVLTYSVDNRKTFEEIQKFWLLQIKKNCGENGKNMYI